MLGEKRSKMEEVALLVMPKRINYLILNEKVFSRNFSQRTEKSYGEVIFFEKVL